MTNLKLAIFISVEIFAIALSNCFMLLLGGDPASKKDCTNTIYKMEYEK